MDIIGVVPNPVPSDHINEKIIFIPIQVPQKESYSDDFGMQEYYI